MDARETADAQGRLVTPGFLDVHIPFDGQAIWDEQLAPSRWHSVTPIVTRDCGGGFAPVVPGREQTLIDQLEGDEADVLGDPIEPYDHPLSSMVRQGYSKLLTLGGG